MCPKIRLITILGIILLINSLTTSVHARRKARQEAIDSPIENAADAPLEDNIATASGSDLTESEEIVEVPNESRKTEATVVESTSSSNNECSPDNISFELVTGYMFSAPNALLDSVPGTLMLNDCLEQCQANDSCSAVNYETGLCVLFSANADKLPGALTKSQFPVFTIYAQKTKCLKQKPCDRPWCIDRVQGYALRNHVKRSSTALSRQDCYEMCFRETEFYCRSANWYPKTNVCELSEMDRITLSGLSSAFKAKDDAEYLESNCVEEPTKLCEFKHLGGKILKTVDAVYQDVNTIEECRELCLNSPFKCRSYDYNDTGEMVCRLSHHNRVTLADIQEPYLEVPEATTHELAGCYNVSIECHASDMVAKIRTSKLFDGKVYAKGSPNSCSVDVKNSLEFELRMGYQDLECNVRQNGNGRYLNDVVIQHHDMIVTSSDLGLALTCQYDLTNKTVSNQADLDINGEIEPALSEEVIVDSPNVIMKITTRDGSDLRSIAEVGDPLALKFEIMDKDSPFEIFVRELVAMDGVDSGEIVLIDSRGCPTDQFILGPVLKMPQSQKILISHFDAFKFPSSPTVQFRALVTPCMPSCEPIQCDDEMNGGGELRSILSYGRKRRSVNSTNELNLRRNRRKVDEKTNMHEDLLLVQTIQINDKFGFANKHQQTKPTLATTDNNNSETVFYVPSSEHPFCVNGIGLIVTGTVFLLAQLVVIALWMHQRDTSKLRPSMSSTTSSIYDRNYAAFR
ncbi:uncharacterized protein [Chironomus tepperi]|uniref:uncharacterized protein n=1 Tax=Chironomus tepperi TaxID=113505 RepID=UPI00391F1C8D